RRPVMLDGVGRQRRETGMLCAICHGRPRTEGAVRAGRSFSAPDPGEVVLLSKVFDGLTVIELADRRNQMVGKILSDAGARVIQIEPTEGSPGRWVGPYVNDVQDVNKSLDYWWYNTGKESVAVDIT